MYEEAAGGLGSGTNYDVPANLPLVLRLPVAQQIACGQWCVFEGAVLATLPLFLQLLVALHTYSELISVRSNTPCPRQYQYSDTTK